MAADRMAWQEVEVAFVDVVAPLQPWELAVRDRARFERALLRFFHNRGVGGGRAASVMRAGPTCALEADLSQETRTPRPQPCRPLVACLPLRCADSLPT